LEKSNLSRIVFCELNGIESCFILALIESYSIDWRSVSFLQGARPAPMRLMAGFAALIAAAGLARAQSLTTPVPAVTVPHGFTFTDGAIIRYR
jgi:hypothetical protein